MDIAQHIELVLLGKGLDFRLIHKLKCIRKRFRIDVRKLIFMMEFTAPARLAQLRANARWYGKWVEDMQEHYNSEYDLIVARAGVIYNKDPSVLRAQRHINDDQTHARANPLSKTDPNAAAGISPGVEFSLMHQAEPDGSEAKRTRRTLRCLNNQLHRDARSRRRCAHPCVPPDIQLKRDVDPRMVDEFKMNPTILEGRFRHLFLFGVKAWMLHDRTGGLRTGILRRLFGFYDPRFAEAGTLRTHLFSQKLRHGASHNVGIAFKHDKERMAEFEKLLLGKTFQRDIQQAYEHPNLKSSRKLMKRIDRIARLVGRSLPWTPMERKQAIVHVYGQAYMMGLPNWWITFNPSIMDNPLAVRMLQRQLGEAVSTSAVDWAEHKRLPGTQKRAHLLAGNPFESARAFEQTRSVVWNELFGLPNASERKQYAWITRVSPCNIAQSSGAPTGYPCTVLRDPEKRIVGDGYHRGAFGATTAGYMTTECTQRADLHGHALLNGLPGPRMVSEWSHMPKIERAIMEVVDSCTTSRLPVDRRSTSGEEWKALPRMAMREPPTEEYLIKTKPDEEQKESRVVQVTRKDPSRAKACCWLRLKLQGSTVGVRTILMRNDFKK
jgi:hypothetical protein